MLLLVGEERLAILTILCIPSYLFQAPKLWFANQYPGHGGYRDREERTQEPEERPQQQSTTNIACSKSFSRLIRLLTARLSLKAGTPGPLDLVNKWHNAHVAEREVADLLTKEGLELSRDGLGSCPKTVRWQEACGERGGLQRAGRKPCESGTSICGPR